MDIRKEVNELFDKKQVNNIIKNNELFNKIINELTEKYKEIITEGNIFAVLDDKIVIGSKTIPKPGNYLEIRVTYYDCIEIIERNSKKTNEDSYKINDCKRVVSAKDTILIDEKYYQGTYTKESDNLSYVDCINYKREYDADGILFHEVARKWNIDPSIENTFENIRFVNGDTIDELDKAKMFMEKNVESYEVLEKTRLYPDVINVSVSSSNFGEMQFCYPIDCNDTNMKAISIGTDYDNIINTPIKIEKTNVEEFERMKQLKGMAKYLNVRYGVPKSRIDFSYSNEIKNEMGM